MILEFLQINYWLAKLNSTTYLVLFYICVSFVCLVILDIFYVSYSYSRKKLPFMWPLQALRTVAGLISTVIFLPIFGKPFYRLKITDIFTTMIHCETSSSGIYVNWLYSDL